MGPKSTSQRGSSKYTCTAQHYHFHNHNHNHRQRRGGTTARRGRVDHIQRYDKGDHNHSQGVEGRRDHNHRCFSATHIQMALGSINISVQVLRDKYRSERFLIIFRAKILRLGLPYLAVVKLHLHTGHFLFLSTEPDAGERGHTPCGELNKLSHLDVLGGNTKSKPFAILNIQTECVSCFKFAKMDGWQTTSSPSLHCPSIVVFPGTGNTIDHLFSFISHHCFLRFLPHAQQPAAQLWSQQ